MAGGGQQAENTLHENAIGWVILLAVIAVLIWIFWYYNAPEVRNLVRWVRYGEMLITGWFLVLINIIKPVLSMIPGMGSDEYKILYQGELVSWATYFEQTPKWNKAELKYQHLSLFGALAMQPLRYVFIALCALGAWWCIFHGPRTHYRSRMGLEEFIRRQAQNFTVTAPFVEFNPASQPPRPPGSPVPAELPVFAEALGPEEWLSYNGVPAPDGVVDEAAAAKIFQMQLIGRWKGAMALSPYRQVLLAAFCLKASRKREEGDEMLGRLAQCWGFKQGMNLRKDKTLLKEARKILKDKDLSGGTLAKCNQHAFITTALLRALSYAREEGGVLAPPQFVWLRGHDRTLWYPLNNMGRQSYHIEALGAMAHYKIEKLTQRPIPVPKIDFAVETIKEYMASTKARPLPQLDYSGSKKRGVKKAL